MQWSAKESRLWLWICNKKTRWKYCKICKISRKEDRKNIGDIMLIAIALIIIAWVVVMPLWASITLTALAVVHFVIKIIVMLIRFFSGTID